MRSLVIFFFVLGAFTGANSQEVLARRGEAKVDTLSIVSGYLQKLQRLAEMRDSANSVISYPAPNAYYYQILSAPTLYSSPLHQMMSNTDSTYTDRQLQTLYYINRMLARLYARNPELVQQTEENVKNQGHFRDDINEKINVKDKLSEKVSEAMLPATLDEDIQVVTRRPNFWKFNGNTSLQFSQSHFSSNWHKGGEDNFTGNLYLTVNANYNNQRKVVLDNRLEVQVGAQTAPSDSKRSFRPTVNKLRITSNLGYKAYKTLYYSCQVIMETQILPNYYVNTDNLQSKIFSPMDLSVGPGMKYNFQWGKKKRFTGELNVAPLAYHLKYVDRVELATIHGIDAGKHAKHTFGPTATLNTNYKICDQISWASRLLWQSNYHYTKIDWYNEINFSVTKLVNAKLILNPIIDDSAPRFRNDKGQYIMFNENLSIGLQYSF
ncbi:MAG: DUF3078 domain-containing protein [Bacteroidaceae bacterium]|nr:DUF3078 domain-containing protein [Bacteroidaceae bacterium]